MKVLLVNTVPLEANGISTFIINSAKVMSKKGLKVSISAPNVIDNKLRKELIQHNIFVIEIPNRMHNPIKYYLKLKRKMVEGNYDIVHVNGNSTTMAIELLAAKQAHVKLRIAHSHNTTTEHPLINKLLRIPFEKNINGRLACNAAAGNWLFNSKDFTIIKNGVFLKRYIFDLKTRKCVRNRYKISDDEILIGHVGKFNFQKNQKFLLKILRDMDCRYKLMLIGDGPDLEKVKQQAKELGIMKKVTFTGKVNNVNEYLNAFDVFVLPSNFEGQPFVVIEALASGLPVIVSKNRSKEINLTNTVKFISLDNISQWEKCIRSLKIKNKNRKIVSLNNIKILKTKGYDAENNVLTGLIPYYKKYINYYK